MAEIIPAIIGKNFTEVSEKMAQVGGLVNWVQLDVVDGKFAKPASWSNAEDLVVINGKTKIEAHLMIEAPEEVLSEWVKVADRIIVHVEATEHLVKILNTLHDSPVESGVALLMSTDLNILTPHIEKIDVVQLMTIDEIGAYGQPFSERALERIRALRVKFPNVKISVDGGVNLETGRLAIEAGADDLVVGSALWQTKNLEEEIEKFKKL